ncbi:dihydroorotate dehydrogenase electron transfer subunit [Candidatus Aminicenantes bacterium AC-335-G13]|nr:dihydroorotate dehydrogenase electron transfer subunit [Candidatus Aminicenantes bacterium AC-335-G13]
MSKRGFSVILNVMFVDSAQIIGKKIWSDWVLLSLKTYKIAEQARPGQFIMAKVNDSFHPLLRRPFSIHNVSSGEIEIFFQIVGIGTTILSEKKVGEKLNIIGPLGKGFNITSSVQNKEYYLIGGGRGIAPLFFLAKEIKKAGGKPYVLYGAKTEKDLPLLKKFWDEEIQVYPSTEDGTLGWHGLITELFEHKLKERNKIEKIFVCGPHEMMKKIALIAEKNKLDAEYSLESIFGCGIGACWGCVVKLRREKEKWVKACSEGPVFSGKEIIW